MLPHVGAGVLLLMTLLGLGNARAADIDLFQPSGAFALGGGTPQGEEAVVGPVGPMLGLTTSFAQRPTPSRLGVASVEAIMPMTLQGSWAPSERARIDLSLPTYAFVSAPVNDFRGASLGDLRTQVVLPTAGETEGFRYGVAPQLTVPTGTGSALTRTGASAGLAMLFSGRSGPMGWLVDLGLTGAAADVVDDLGLGSSGWMVAGVWGHATDATRFGLELDFHHALVVGLEGPNRAGSIHAFAQNETPSGIALGLLGGTGWLRGVGAPEYRLGATLSWHTDRKPTPQPTVVARDEADCPPGAVCDGEDRDGDGFVDAADMCPDQAEDIDGYADDDGCPEADNDGDGVADIDDACPLVRGPRAQGGCPDQDADGVPDPRDLCPAMAGPEETEGCPDRDRDRIPDIRDACPDRAAPPVARGGASDGCPTGAWVDDDRIVLASPIAFTPGTDSLQDSDATLDDLATLLLENPGLTIVEVAGHTDSRGDRDANQTLSLARAEAVAAALSSRGVASGRLKARGYGDQHPIDTNRTAAGRANNARIEIIPLQGPGVSRPVSRQARPEPTGTQGKLTITVTAGLWGDVYIDGVRLNQGAPFTDTPIDVGAHTLRVVNPSRQLEWEGTISIRPGETLTVEIPWTTWKPE